MKSNHSNEYLNNLRHSCAHLLAYAVKQLYPGALNAIGPSIENGFYQDFDIGKWKVSKDDLPKIEAKMREILPLWQKFTFDEISLEEAVILFKDNKYKVELAREFATDGKKLMTNDPGGFLDLCKMGHIENPSKELQHFKLLSIAGAYWRGNEKNKMLTRIYGTVFLTKEELDKFLWFQEETKKRDHRKLGHELDLFVISANIGKGLPLLTPKGTIVREEILKLEYELEKQNGFQHVVTPHIARSEMYKKTGHWQHYRDVMYEPFGIDEEEYVLKPMNCPHHYMIYSSRPRSYRELPMRLSEPGTCYRFEKTGELSGLLRVRALSIDDSHILMREDQIEGEFKCCINMVKKMFQAFQLKDYYVRLSLSDPSDAVKYIAEEKTWKKAGDILEKIVKDNKLKYIIARGEASFYGPKIDFMVKDSLDREWQMSTLQLDLFMGKKLDLKYIDEKGEEKHPVILHRGLTGSLERTLAILIEHYAGAFPLWLAPVQIVLIPISDKQANVAKKIYDLLIENNIRVELDDRSKPLGAKIRSHTLQKVPYLGIIGDKEIEKHLQMGKQSYFLTIRSRKAVNHGLLSIKEFINLIKIETDSKI